MKIQNHQTKFLIGTAILFTSILVSGSFSPAFATHSYSTGPYSPVDANPSYQGGACSSTSAACADALSTAPEYIESYSNTVVTETANAWNNENSGHSSYGSSPSLLTSGTNIIFAANVTYSGTIQSQPYGTSNLTFEVDGYDTHYYLGGCTFTLADTSSNENGQHRTNCSYGNNNGQDAFYTAGNPETTALEDLTNGPTKVDYWNSNGYFSVDSLWVCDDNSC